MSVPDLEIRTGLFARVPRRFFFNGWTAGTVVVALLFASPILAVLGLTVTPASDIWAHLVSTVLADYVWNTLQLMFGVGIGTLVIGVGCAWLVTMCRFPGRRIFEWALLLPFAAPAYVVAYTYTDLLEYSGPLQSALRAVFGWSSMRDYWFPDIRTLEGAACVMSLVLYPYVYLLSRAAFLGQSVCVLEASRVLGRGPWRGFIEVALPLARPAIAAGVALALMETLNDFGTVEYFAVQTFTVGIYNTWFGMNSLGGAAQLATVLLVFVLVLLGLERAGRRGQKFHQTTSRYRELPGYQLRGGRAAVAMIACGLPVTLGFAVPAFVLAGYSIRFHENTIDRGLADLIWNSVSLSVTAAFLAVAIAMFLAYAARRHGGDVLKIFSRMACVGYAVPGSVLAVGVIIPLAWFDTTVDLMSRSLFGVSTGLILGGTLAAVLFGFVCRFLALSFGAVDAGLAKVTPNIDDASRTLGANGVRTLWRVHIPMIRGSVLTAML
ncbi:MAG: iron ABC transporter permease, partial [Alphaproteobacteria bacterium]|nr:iron ABC transporter permease [Alphaproteobacteria bacterium]